MKILKVSTKSSPSLLAGAIAGVIRESSEVELQAIGAGAVNQAVKAIAIARGFMESVDVDLICRPSFADIVLEGEEQRTAIRMIVETTPLKKE